jgi:hypothetical protein
MNTITLLEDIKALLTDEGLNKHQKLVDKITIAIEQLNNKIED